MIRRKGGGFVSAVSVFRRRRGGVQRIIDGDLLGNGQFLASAAAWVVQAATATVIGTPLTKGAVGTGMFFGSLVGH